MSLTPEALMALSTAFTEAIREATRMAAESTTGTTTSTHSKPPSFKISEYRSSDGATVEDYFKRFEWALKLSKIAEEHWANFARVHMGTELNQALKFLVSPRSPEDLTFEQIRDTLKNHIDRAKNKFAESIRFRKICQQKDETVASFALRLRQGAVHCEYGEFLDRMLIEQLLHGLESSDTCDEIIAKKPATFDAAFDIAHTLEATRLTANEVKTTMTPAPEATHKLGYTQPKKKYGNKQGRQRSSSRNRQQQYQHKQKDFSKKKQDQRCQGCGRDHPRSQCQFRDAECHNCGIKGHIATVCRSKKKEKSDQVSDALVPADHVDSIQYFNKVNDINTSNLARKRMINVSIDGHNLEMELDTGAPCGIVSKKMLHTIKPTCLLQKTDRQFASYTSHKINCIGRLPVNVTIGRTTKRLNLYVVDGNFDTLMGREWISHFTHEIDFAKLFSSPDGIHAVSTVPPCLTAEQKGQLDQLLNRFQDVFDDVAGKLSGPPVKIHLKPEATPVFAKAREIPYALRDAYAREIDAKIKSGLYKKVDYSEWASTTHVVTKKNGKIRITGNYKPTLNPRIIIDEHPIPRAESIFNQMRGATTFCHLDITDAYSHLPVDEEFSHALTLNTPTHGLIRPTRAVYGAANIPAIWQRRMESVLQDLPKVRNFFDDVLLFADNFADLMITLEKTLERMRSHGLRLNRTKCVFASPSVEFLGHKIDAQGIHKSDKHIEAIRDAPKPSTHEELQLFLGKATYYNAYIPDLSTRDRPLRDILRQETFKWTPAAEKAFKEIKTALISPQVLMPYDPSLPLLLATDASKTGLGAVLSHRLSNGRERPIAYASRTMTTTEQKYPQIDKEALAIVWAVQKFFHYLYARHWTLITDHKPLTQILHPEKSLPVLCISRMANYADYLAHFDFDVIFKSTKENTNADYCSRASLSSTINAIQDSSPREKEEFDGDEFDHFIIKQIKQLPIDAEQIARETRKDPALGKIIKLLETGQNLERAGYKAPESAYKLASNCLVFEHRVVIPLVLRKAMLDDLHAAHLGIVKMKGMARSFIYWPGIDPEIERTAKSCVECAKHAHAPPKFRQHHWDYPKGPWERIHIDYAGPVAGMMLLIVSDAFSKWLEVKATNSMTTAATIAILDNLFTAHGVPTTVVSDNGTQFTSSEFKSFLQTSGVKYHKLTAPYHPSTNGQAERSVQTVKAALRAMGTTRSTLQEDLNRFLRHYRIAPHSTTEQSPSQLFLGRTLRTRLDLVRPDDVFTKVTQKWNSQFVPTFRSLKPTQVVYFLSGNPRMDKWIRGIITTRLGDLHYEIDYNGRRFKRHIDQIRGHEEGKTAEQSNVTPAPDVSNNWESRQPRRVRFYPDTSEAHTPVAPTNAKIQSSPVPQPRTSTRTTTVSEQIPSTASDRGVIRNGHASPPVLPRRSTRDRRLPNRFSPSR
ncbi:uncharacterized protein K02A2.6-like [Solenopsis invicta]|uniref:uncharacterized protein K02A2.6-like n=1 Tax=Solenopsis invicta TaxID=13686 RepID=UPI00193EB4DD|nr:uncharacterized protein K02A2.6-like [Solenopsis invicta]